MAHKSSRKNEDLSVTVRTENTRLIRCLFYHLTGGKGKHFKSKVEQVHLTDVCQRNKTHEFHWLLKIVARLQHELRSLNENLRALFLLFCFLAYNIFIKQD